MLARHEPVKIRDAIEDTYRKKGYAKKIAAKESSRLKESICIAVDDHLRTFRIRGIKEFYQRDVEKPDVVIPCPDAGKYRWTAFVQSALLTLSPREFEIVVANSLALNECDQIAVTPATSDGGFDYVGRVQLGGADLRFDPGPNMFRDQYLYAFGQVKRYDVSHPVEIGELDQMVGVSQSIVKGGGTPVKDKMIELLNGWGWNRNAPVKSCFATSGRYRSTVPTYAVLQQLAIFDGEQIAQRLLGRCDSLPSEAQVLSMVRDVAQSVGRKITIL